MRQQRWVLGDMDAYERVFNFKGDLEEEPHIVLSTSPAEGRQVEVRLISAE